MTMEELLAECNRREEEFRQHQTPESKEKFNAKDFKKHYNRIRRSMKTLQRYIENYDARQAELAEAFPLCYAAPDDELSEDKDNDEFHGSKKKRSLPYHLMQFFHIDLLTTTHRQQLIKEYDILQRKRFVAFPNDVAIKANKKLYMQYSHLIESKLDEIKEEKWNEEAPILIALSNEENPDGLELFQLTSAARKLATRSRMVLDETIPHDNEAQMYRTALNDLPVLKAASLPTVCDGTIQNWYKEYLRYVHAQQERLCRSCIKLTSVDNVSLLAERYETEALISSRTMSANNNRINQEQQRKESYSANYTSAMQTSFVTSLISLNTVDKFEGELPTIHIE